MRLRLRPRTIRTQLLALVLVPMISLAALWTYGSYTTLSGAFALIRVNTTDRYYGLPANAVTLALQGERKAAVDYDASNGTHGAAALRAAERMTDARVAMLRDHLQRRAEGPALSADQNGRVSDVLTGIAQLPGLRATVNDRNTNWSDVLDDYSAVIDPELRLRSSLTELQIGEVARKGSVVIELARARELLSQEDAMVLGGRDADGMTDSQYRNLIGTIDGRQLLHEIYEPELPVADGAKLEDFEDGSVGWSLFALEEEARAATPLTAASSMPTALWQHTVDTALAQLGSIDADSTADVDTQAHNMGMQVLGKSAAILLAGLLAVIASLLISLRIGRRIASRLTGLRDTAEELSGRRLPEMMRRLREGDPVEDVAATAWPASPQAPGHDYVDDFGDDEIGQVGRAFGVAQRAAVQAAVEQARLRRGVAAVFTTIARRSQVLLHRQLALLDAMERRTQNAAELDDLFRLDHMTNRMRRHAEGLLILSGLTPGRAWRRPVRMAEVVRAAVGEVDNYERIVVRRMPGVALVGPAVADVLHLLAELMENATSFSPPDTEVLVRGEKVAIGFVIEIEDRGLGMNAERLAEANQAIQDSSERSVDGVVEGADLPETDRLGLFTVGRLAARHNVRVTLRRTAGDGTLAVVLIPQESLAAPEDVEPEVTDGADTLTGLRAGGGPRRNGDRRNGSANGRAVNGGSASGSGNGDGDGDGDGVNAGGVGDGDGVPDGVRDGVRDGGPGVGDRVPGGVDGGSGWSDGEDESAAAPVAVRKAPAPPAPRPAVAADLTTASGLPRRVPSRNLSPRLREEHVSHDRPSRDLTDGSGKERSPEEARSIAAAYARGLALGRADSVTRLAGHGDRTVTEAAESAMEEAEQGETAPENAIEKVVTGEKAVEEDGGQTS